MKKMVIVLIVGIMIGSAAGSWAAIHQPHMMAALEALNHARAELEAGEHNKGGHRVKALEFVEKAIEQTKKGIEVGERER
jgi:cytochrome bd-type quinol oxidase subunit 1